MAKPLRSADAYPPMEQNQKWAWNTRLVDVLMANGDVGVFFEDKSQSNLSTLNNWAKAVDDQAKKRVLRLAFRSVFGAESTLDQETKKDLYSQCVIVLDNAVQTLQEHEASDAVKSAIEEVVQSGVHFKEILEKHMAAGTGLLGLNAEHFFKTATSEWIKRWGPEAQKSSASSKISSCVSAFYDTCHDVWTRGNSVKIPVKPVLPELLETVLDKLPKTLAYLGYETRSLPTLNDLRNNHLDKVTELKLLGPRFAKSAPRGQSGWLPVDSNSSMFEPEFMCTFDHLQFTDRELPGSKYLDLTGKCSFHPASRSAFMVLAPSATGKTGAAIRTLCRRGGWYIDFHEGRIQPQFYENKALTLAKSNISDASPAFVMGHVYVWLLSYVLYTALIRKSLRSTATASDMVRAQLNSNRNIIAAVYEILVNDLELYKLSAGTLIVLIDNAIAVTRLDGDRYSFDTLVFDEAQVIKEQTKDSKGYFYSIRGTERGLLTVILRAISTLTNIQNLFVMGTSHSIDLSALLESSVGKRSKWRSAQAISILPHHFILTRQHLKMVLRSMLSVENGDHYIDLAVSRPEIEKILPLRGRVLSLFLDRLSQAVKSEGGELLPQTNGNNSSSSSSSSKKKEEDQLGDEDLSQQMSDILFRSLMAAYDNICMQIFARLVERPVRTEDQIGFNVEELDRIFGEDVDRLIGKNGTARTSSLYSIVARAILGETTVELDRMNQSLTSAEQKEGFDMKDWLSVGIVGAEEIKLDEDAKPEKIVYRLDEPLTQRICRMLLEVAHRRHIAKSFIDPDFESYSATQILRHGSESNRFREMAVGLMFCRESFQGKVLSELPFIRDVSVKLSRSGKDPAWLSEVQFACKEYVLLEQLVSSLPLDGMTIVLSNHLEGKDALKDRLQKLGAKVLKRVTADITHYVCTTEPKDRSDKNRRTRAVKHGAVIVSRGWADQCCEMMVAVSEDRYRIQLEDSSVSDSSSSSNSSSRVSEKRKSLADRSRLSRLKDQLRSNPDSVVFRCINFGNHIHPDLAIILRDDKGRLFAIFISIKVHRDNFQVVEKKSQRSLDVRLFCQDGYLDIPTEELSKYPLKVDSSTQSKDKDAEEKTSKDMSDIREFMDMFHGFVRMAVHLSEVDSPKCSDAAKWAEKTKGGELQEKEVFRILQGASDTEKLVPRNVVKAMFN